ncbi:MAG TPA: peptidoglycan-binding domain-containing protein [Acidobacteriaceae bacterium]
MRVSRIQVVLASVLLALPGLAVAGPTQTSSKHHTHASVKHTSAKRTTSTKRSSSKRSSTKRSRSRKEVHHEAAAVVMPAERATEIQTALIKQGYLTGEPTGTWDATTVSAMQKLQSDNGWQSKVTPDARALIKLGLGPEPLGSGTGPTSASMIAQTPPR